MVLGICNALVGNRDVRAPQRHKRSLLRLRLGLVLADASVEEHLVIIGDIDKIVLLNLFEFLVVKPLLLVEAEILQTYRTVQFIN